MERQQTVPPYVPFPWASWVNVAAVFTALVLLTGTVWTVGSVINAKANQSEVHVIRDHQSVIKQDIAVTKNDIAQIKEDISQIKQWVQPPPSLPRSH